MLLNEIHLRDPYILTDGGKYYLYGTRGRESWTDRATGLDGYVSTDLTEWEKTGEVFTPPEGFWADRNFWAPEVHRIGSRYYMFVSFADGTGRRGTQILASDRPEGPFVLHSDGPVTPRDWVCLDGTFLEAGGRPYMVFCHEWVQIRDGGMCLMPLTEDLKAAAGEPVTLFHASEAPWADKAAEQWVTDGPFLYRTEHGRLIMLWSSLIHDGGEGRYCEALAYSDSGDPAGPWRQGERLLFERDGGHGMIFRTREGELRFVCHQPNVHPQERPQLFRLVERDDDLFCEDAL